MFSCITWFSHSSFSISSVIYFFLLLFTLGHVLLSLGLDGGPPLLFIILHSPYQPCSLRPSNTGKVALITLRGVCVPLVTVPRVPGASCAKVTGGWPAACVAATPCPEARAGRCQGRLPFFSFLSVRSAWK